MYHRPMYHTLLKRLQEAQHPDLLLAMNQKSCDDFFNDMIPGDGLLGYY